MQDHIRDLLSRFQYSEQLREIAVFRILFGGEGVSQVMADLGFTVAIPFAAGCNSGVVWFSVPLNQTTPVFVQ